MIYFKEFNPIEMLLLTYFGVFNLHWIDMTYMELGLSQPTIFWLPHTRVIGILLLIYILGKMIGFKKKEVKQK